MVQNFDFTPNKGLEYGLVQKEGGPCGVVATVQAFVLKALIDGKNLKPNAAPSRDVLKAALAKALADILWGVGGGKSATVVLKGSSSSRAGAGPPGYKSDGITEKCQLYVFSSFSSLHTFLTNGIAQFTSPSIPSCIYLVYSVILTRTVEGVRDDMDERGGRLMGAHSYCTQDLVNLMITGKASSNVFDGNKTMGEGKDAFHLKGIASKAPVGLLSLFEHCNPGIIEVGQNLKSPDVPVWVVCSESHYSALFSFSSMLSKGPVDVYYYDPLGRQEDVYRIAVDPDSTEPVPDEKDVMVSPIDHCIRTRWRGAEVSWQDGVDPVY